MAEEQGRKPGSDVLLDDIDHPAIARALAQIADQPSDLADAFFEWQEQIELPPDDQAPGFRVWRESGLALRLIRQGRTYLAARDHISSQQFEEALRRVARAMPRAPYPHPRFGSGQWSEAPRATEMLTFPATVQKAIRAHRVSLPARLTVRRHRRTSLVVGPQVSSSIQEEMFYSLMVELPWGARHGTLLTTLDDEAAAKLARSLVSAQRSQEAASPSSWQGPCVLGPAATAVLLHEAIAHTLEAATLALSGHPEAAIGTPLASPSVSVIDDPGSAPEGVRRTCDDEGSPVIRRFLLRDGAVDQPLCDQLWARQSEVLLAGAGRRGSRHLPPGPRSTHLELAPGELSRQELLADAEGGLFLPEAERGRLDPISGQFTLHFPFGRRIEHQTPGSPIGPCRLSGHVTDLLAAITGISHEKSSEGAGWCAKGGIKLPVWATVPYLRLQGVVIEP